MFGLKQMKKGLGPNCFTIRILHDGMFDYSPEIKTALKFFHRNMVLQKFSSVRYNKAGRINMTR